MDAATESLVRVSAALAARDRARLEATLREAARAADHDAVEEVVLQAYLFVGYPVSLNAFAVWRDLRGSVPEAASDDPTGWARRGEDVCRAVYGRQYEGLRANVRRLHPDMERWMVAEGYGKVLGRPGLDLRTRELCIAALLVVLDAPRQLYSHLRGALHVGATTDDVEAVIRIGCAFAAPAAAEGARRTWTAVQLRRDEGS